MLHVAPGRCAAVHSILTSVTMYAPVIITAHAVNYLSCSLLAILINPSRAISKYLMMKLLSVHTINYQLPLKFFWEEYRIKKSNVLLPFQNIISSNTLHKLLLLTGLDRDLKEKHRRQLCAGRAHGLQRLQVSVPVAKS